MEKLKVIVIGTRGIPNYLGGVESHCQELYPRLVSQGCDVEVVRRSAYKSEKDEVDNYKGVRLVDIFSPKKKSIEAIIHTFLAVCYARTKSPDVLHIHAIGPSLLVPFARLLGMKVVTTNHGPDYDRDKWGGLAKFFLKLGERLGAQFSNKVIVISTVIGSILRKKYGVDSELVYNGITHKKYVEPSEYLETLGVKKGRYIVGVGRFVKEKGFHDLIDAYNKLVDPEVKLVLIGDTDHEDKYSLDLKAKARDSGVITTGFISGEKLVEVFSNAKLFVMPSYHEGLPIALLEAMSFSLPVLVSDIPANKAVELEPSDYFNVGDVNLLTDGIAHKLNDSSTVEYTEYMKKYDWDSIAEQTLSVYRSIL